MPLGDAGELFRFAGEALAFGAHKAARDFERRLHQRQARASTALGQGLALPHADSALATTMQALFVRTAAPLAFGAPDGLPVSAFFFLVVPRPARSAHHALLARLRELLCRPDRIAALHRPAAAETVASLWREALSG